MRSLFFVRRRADWTWHVLTFGPASLADGLVEILTFGWVSPGLKVRAIQLHLHQIVKNRREERNRNV